MALATRRGKPKSSSVFASQTRNRSQYAVISLPSAEPSLFERFHHRVTEIFCPGKVRTFAVKRDSTH